MTPYRYLFCIKYRRFIYTFLMFQTVQSLQKEEGLSRQSSVLSLVTLLDEQADSDNGDADSRKKKRRRRGHGWGKSKEKEPAKIPQKDDSGSTESRSQVCGQFSHV